MAFRLLRICSSEDVFETRLEELKTEFLVPRNYHPRIIDAEFKKIRNLPGDNFSETKTKCSGKKETQSEENKKANSAFQFKPIPSKN